MRSVYIPSINLPEDWELKGEVSQTLVLVKKLVLLSAVLLAMASITLVVVLSSAVCAHAQLVEPSVEAFEQADVIAAGRVVGVTPKRTDSPDGTWSISTSVKLKVARCLKGECGSQQQWFVPGGELPGSSMEVGHQPKFSLGEEVLVFLRDGKVLHAELGKVDVDLDAPAPDHLMLEPGQPDRRTLEQKLRDRYHLAPPAPTAAPLSQAPVTPSCCRHWGDPWPHYLGTVKPIPPTDPDPKLGAAASARVIDNAIRWWANESGLKYQIGSPRSAVGFACGGQNELLVSFDDPKDQISPPTNCAGALAIGGFCSGPVVDGMRQIQSAALVFADGWGNCPFADEANMTTIGAHEVGHTLGFAHSCETSEQSTCSQDARTALMNAYLNVGTNALKQCDKDCAHESYGFGQPTPTPTGQPIASPTASPLPSVTPTPGACPPGQHWKPKNKCPYPSGKWGQRCHCVADAATIGIGPSGCSSVPTPSPQPWGMYPGSAEFVVDNE